MHDCCPLIMQWANPSDLASRTVRLAKMLVLIVAGALFSILLYLCVRFCHSPFQVLRRNGIKGPKPSVFYGNYQDRLKEGIIKYSRRLHREYGPIVGNYIGQVPEVLVTDLELIRLFTVKDFGTFIDRPLFPEVVTRPVGLLRMRGETWRSNRQILSPTFSPYKMKAMTPIIQNSVDGLVEVFAAQADTNQSFEVFRSYGAFTMETILATAFGRVIDLQRGMSDKLTEAAATLFSSTREDQKTNVHYILMVLSNFPWLEKVIRVLHPTTPRLRAYYVIYDVATRILEQRRKEKDAGKKYKDLLQLMIDATAEEVEGVSGNKKKLTDGEIVGNAITFMLAGYETTANALSYTSYLLALNPHIQDKLQAEIDAYYQDNPDSSIYQAAQDIEYLDMVLHESLRLYPPAARFSRECNKDYRYKDITIPKGSLVAVSVFLLHKDPEHWKDPDEFDPMRFSAAEKAKRPQFCYMPFGSGPRSCIGMRFALLEAKMALIELLKRFTFVRAPDTQVPLETVVGITTSPKDGIYLKIVTRE